MTGLVEDDWRPKDGSEGDRGEVEEGLPKGLRRFGCRRMRSMLGSSRLALLLVLVVASSTRHMHKMRCKRERTRHCSTRGSSDRRPGSNESRDSVQPLRSRVLAQDAATRRDGRNGLRLARAERRAAALAMRSVSGCERIFGGRGSETMRQTRRAIREEEQLGNQRQEQEQRPAIIGEARQME